jgi:photosystem II stability/assembly factor-like uncharacterized protein
MKKRITFCFLLASVCMYSQNDLKSDNDEHLLNFNVIKAAAEKRFAKEMTNANEKSQSFNNNSGPVEKENDYLKFKRWENYWKDRVMPDGSFPDIVEQSALHKSLQNAIKNKSGTAISNWVNISQTSATGGYHGMGRAISIAFHPTNPNIYWVGAPKGGIWKTIDGGQSYSPLGDNLPVSSVGTIVVNKTNPDIIYVTIGDYGGLWDYGLGVYKTTDGGITWAPTGLVSPYASSVVYNAMCMSPTNPNVILVARSNGLFRTSDGGTTWTLVRSGGHRDIKFRPNDSSTVYVSSDDLSGASEVYKSINGGLNFSKISSFNNPQTTILLTVTPSNPNVLGILVKEGAYKEYYNSLNNGNTINFISNVPERDVIFISPTNANKVYNGGIDVYGSTNGGATWNQVTNWYNNGIHPEVHADQRFVASNPLNNKIYFCNDGGIYSLNESNNNWEEFNNGLIITQFYSIAVSQSDPVFMIGGTQDNGGRKRTGINTWDRTNAGDAMETAIDASNDQTIYTTYTYGTLYRSYDRWTLDFYNEITPPGISGNWVTPFTLDPNNQSTIIAGYQDVYKSTNQGTTWVKISNNLTGSASNKLDEIAVAPSNSNVIYAARGNKFYATSNGGTNWSTYTLPFTNVILSDASSITVDPFVANIVYVTVGGYSTGKKVYKSINSGAAWTNISGTLPNVPVSTCIIDKSSSTHEIYIGTDVGVFYINDFISTWTYYGNNLPNTAVSDLEIQYGTKKLRAATYGRGIWETDLISGVSGVSKPNILSNGNRFNNAYNPIKDVLYINANIIKDVDATLHFYNTKGELSLSLPKHFQQGNYQTPIDISRLSNGMYFVKIKSDNDEIALKIMKE